jgi:uncharacterized protein (DUF885 family)
MNGFLQVLAFVLLLSSCAQKPSVTGAQASADLDSLFDQYYEERLKLYPLNATANGDNRYNDRLTIPFTDSFRDTLRSFYKGYLDQVSKFDREGLDENNRLSYDVFVYELNTQLNLLQFPINLIPTNQFEGLHLTLGQYGSGDGMQPFKTVTDYENWVKRVSVFPAWVDSAIVYYNKGIKQGVVLPKILVQRMIPQMRAMETRAVSENIFYGPITKMPDTFSNQEKQRLTELYTKTIAEQIVPAYKKLGDYLEQQYLTRGSNKTGLVDMPNGKEWYNAMVQYWTTTAKSPDEIYNTGLAEVKRIRDEMENIRKQTRFQGSLNEFFQYLKTDSKFTPFRSEKEVLDAFRAIQSKIDPHLSRMFTKTPKTPFEIRQTEAFRAASASAEYFQGSPDGSRPGIFYVPILNAEQFNITSGMESLFLHEAIPGHHYQISLQQENDSLPKFRRFSWYGAYGEGWALYCESLGKELGLYTDPYQHMGALGDEIHRAIRLVVDVGIHAKGWTREQAIKYMMDNEAISEQGAVAEIERYMVLPGQALSYKIGALKIAELRKRYETKLVDKFNLAQFHDRFLKDGCMPLDVLEKKMEAEYKLAN